jgi:hypothetical protein
MDSLPSDTSMLTRIVKLPQGDPRIDVGMIVLEESQPLTGRIVAADGASTAQARLVVTREGTPDLTFASALPDGRFVVRGVPHETVSLLVDLKGYRLSSKNRGLDPKTLDPRLRVGPQDRDRELTILMEPVPR